MRRGGVVRVTRSKFERVGGNESERWASLGSDELREAPPSRAVALGARRPTADPREAHDEVDFVWMSLRLGTMV